ncbi:hypothetical protein rosmuc_00324 [Roseovarius mucosus DSM 17069]|uniref:Uncharacterized protein n=1 Tax=Roseovarius mucosus DSM 17069 TaxID=1288298 RepID=A0A0A0HR06_9RHOB|nr:hypothetical protein rosmuc_00324 [Roseovarius mucosus DSM 17069]
MSNSTISSVCSSGSEAWPERSAVQARGERPEVFPHAAQWNFRKHFREYAKSLLGCAKRALCDSYEKGRK